jgi:hypothetical protein
VIENLGENMPILIQAISIDKDDRLGSFCVTAKCTYRDFLQITTDAEQSLTIQRSIIGGSKAYATLRADLKRGCILPPIVLAFSVQLNSPVEQLAANNNLNQLTSDLSAVSTGSVYVIDGLQRTNAIRQTRDELAPEEKEIFLERSLRIEVWLNISFGAIAYRMLLLNAGQRPMSIKHQVEVLSSKLVDDLSSIPNLQIFRIGDTRRRTQPGQFNLAKLGQAFQAWLQGQPNLDLRNTVMEQLLAESAVDILGQTISPRTDNHTDGFYRFVAWLVAFDSALGDSEVSFLGNETVVLGIAAAVGAMERNEQLSIRVWPALQGLLVACQSHPDSDPAAVQTFNLLKQGILPSKENVGAATRDMVFAAFKEFIRGAGETPMDECWRISAAKS